MSGCSCNQTATRVIVSLLGLALTDSFGPSQWRARDGDVIVDVVHYACIDANEFVSSTSSQLTRRDQRGVFRKGIACPAIHASTPRTPTVPRQHDLSPIAGARCAALTANPRDPIWSTSFWERTRKCRACRSICPRPHGSLDSVRPRAQWFSTIWFEMAICGDREMASTVLRTAETFDGVLSHCRDERIKTARASRRLQ
jgi:hypothetical protein